MYFMLILVSGAKMQLPFQLGVTDSVTSKPRCKKGEPTYQLIQGAFQLQVSCTKHTGFCHAMPSCIHVLDLRHFGAGDSKSGS